MSTVLLRAGGTTVGVLLGLVTGVWEIFLSPLYAGSVPLPVAPILAVATNLALVWYTYHVTGHRLLALLPGAAWFVVVIAGLTKTGEGDLVMPGNDWMGLLVILLGALAWGIGGYRLILAPPADQAAAVAAPPADGAAPQAGGAAAPGGGQPARPARAPRPGARPAKPGDRSARPGDRRSGGGRSRP